MQWHEQLWLACSVNCQLALTKFLSTSELNQLPAFPYLLLVTLFWPLPYSHPNNKRFHQNAFYAVDEK
jgi:hypothetical protein